jgi:hypothetical protein
VPATRSSLKVNVDSLHGIDGRTPRDDERGMQHVTTVTVHRCSHGTSIAE